MKLDYYSDGLNKNVQVGDVVDIYLVYLNSDINLRDSPGTIIFKKEILGLGLKYDETLYFSDSRFSITDYPNNDLNINGLSKRRFEPSNWDNGIYNKKWEKKDSDDYYKISAQQGSTVDNLLEIGFKNDEKGDFLRVITGDKGV